MNGIFNSLDDLKAVITKSPVTKYSWGTGSWKVYALVDPLTWAVRYVGASASPNERVEAWKKAFNTQPAVKEWLMDMAATGSGPTILLLGASSARAAAYRLRHKWRAWMRRKKWPLLVKDWGPARQAKQWELTAYELRLRAWERRLRLREQAPGPGSIASNEVAPPEDMQRAFANLVGVLTDEEEQQFREGTLGRPATLEEIAEQDDLSKFY